MMESVAAARRNHVTGTDLTVVGTPVMTDAGVRLKGGTNYFVGVPEALTQTIYLVGKLLVPITGSGNRPVLIGSRVGNGDMGIAIYPAAVTPDLSVMEVRCYAGLTTGSNVGAAARVLASGGVDMTGLVLMRGQVRDGLDVSMADLTHDLIGAPVALSAARKLSASQPLSYGSDNSGSYLGECVLSCIVIVNGVPSTQEDAAIVAGIRAEMAYWGVAEGM
ncbi:hypothetical protein [Muricoccus roseus]|nr:hypothetical protein [Roseomonas rosea]